MSTQIDLEMTQHHACMQNHPAAYRDAARKILFTNLPYLVNERIHRHRRLCDLTVPYHNVKFILGYFQSIEKDKVLDNIFLRSSLTCGKIIINWKEDRDVVLAAVTQDGYALQYASDELRSDKEIVLAAVTQYGYALQYASAELRSDKEIVLVAVNQDGHALQYASAELRSDKEIVLAAVTQYGYALQYASDEWRSDKEIVLAAVTQDGYSHP